MNWPSEIRNWLPEIRKLEYKDVSRYTSAFLGTIAAGFLIIFHFKPELIEKYDGFKLVVLSLILTLPLLALNASPGTNPMTSSPCSGWSRVRGSMPTSTSGLALPKIIAPGTCSPKPATITTAMRKKFLRRSEERRVGK